MDASWMQLVTPGHALVAAGLAVRLAVAVAVGGLPLTAGTSLRRGGGQPAAAGTQRFPVDPAVRRLVRQARSQLEPAERARTVNFIQANAFLVDHRDAPLTLPHDYQYDDAEPGTVVAPHVLWGEVPARCSSTSPTRCCGSTLISASSCGSSSPPKHTAAGPCCTTRCRLLPSAFPHRRSSG